MLRCMLTCEPGEQGKLRKTRIIGENDRSSDRMTTPDAAKTVPLSALPRGLSAQTNAQTRT